MNNYLKNKLAELPKTPGVYFHKNAQGEIIYVGKAAVLKNRVRQYFQASRYRDPKTDLLVEEIADVDWIEVDSEADALFLEAEMVKRYMPRYNILLRDDKSNIYIRINLKDYAPTVTTPRRPLGDEANYYGPFLQGGAVKKALKYLRRAFPYSTHTTLPGRACLHYHIGLCPGPENPDYDRLAYINNLKNLIKFIEGKKTEVITKLEKEMAVYSDQQNYEAAALIRNKLTALKTLQTQVIFGDSERLDLSKDHALADLNRLLRIKVPLRRIEAYDISHLQGTDNVASMIVFLNGVPSKSNYRKFKLLTKGNDDYAHMREVVTRRFSAQNLKKWPKPDLILIDGGKGQLKAAIEAIAGANISIPVLALSKKYEEIIVHKTRSGLRIDSASIKKLKGFIKENSDYQIINLPPNSNAVKLLQRIRDESHRFAVSYHSSLKLKRQTGSVLDDIAGIGPLTKKKLLKYFGSLPAIKSANRDNIAEVVGKNRAELVYNYFHKS